MAKSTLTIAELQAQAMLLGYTYDWGYHIFIARLTINAKCYDPETLELVFTIGVEHMGKQSVRKTAVQRGELGAKDYSGR